MIGAGAAAAVVGAIVLVGGLDKQSEATAACPKTDKARICTPPLDANQVQQDYDDGKSKAVLGGIVMGVGAAAVVGGVVWMVIDRGASSTTALSPWVGPSSAGVAWSNRF